MSNLKSQMLSWQNWMWVLCTLLTCAPVVHCEYPITPALLPEDNECNGGTAMFNWTYSPATPDPNSITWTKRYSDGTRAATLATFVFKNFTVDPAYAGRVKRTGTTGQIELSNIQSTDEGIYRIEVFDVNDSKTTNGTGNLNLLEPPIGSLVVTAGDRSLNVSRLTSLGFPAARVICKNEENETLVNNVPPFVLSYVACGTYTCCIESLAVSKCLPSTDPLRTCKVVAVDGLGCWPLLIVGFLLLVGGIVITVIFVLRTLEFMSEQSDPPPIVQPPKDTIIVRDLKDEKEVEASFERYLNDNYVNVVKKTDAENRHTVWTIKGEARLSFNQRSGKCLNGTFEIKFKPGGPSIGNFRIEFEHTGLSIVQQEKNTIYVLNLTKPKEVEASFERYLKDNYSDVVKKSCTENGHKVWTIKGGEAHLSLNPPKGKVNVQHSKNTICVLDLTDQEEVEASFESYLKKHYDNVVKKNGHTVWTMKGGMAHLSFNSKKGKIIGTFEIKFKENDRSVDQLPKNTIIVKHGEEVEASFEKYLKRHYADVVQMILAKAHSNKIAESPDELAFQKEDVLTVIEKDTGKDGLWLCSLRGKPGLVPTNKVYILSEEMILAKAHSNKIAESPDELAFQTEDVLTVIKKDTGKDGLWLCSLRGKPGLVPANKVYILSERNGDKVWTIKGGEAYLSLNPPKGKVYGTFEIKFKQSDLSIVRHPKNTIFVPDLTNQEEVEARCDSYLKKHYDDVVKNSDAENGHTVWTIKGEKAYLSFMAPNGEKNRPFKIKFGLSIVRHPKITMEPVLADQKEVEASFESYLKKHFNDVVKKNGDKVWTITVGEALLSFNPTKGKINGQNDIMFQQGDPSIGQNDIMFQQGDPSIGQNDIMFQQGDPSIADKLRLVNFIYSIIHCAAGLIMMIIIAVLACTPLEGVCIGAHIFSLLNLLYGFGNIILTLTWKHKNYVWLRWHFCGCSG